MITRLSRLLFLLLLLGAGEGCLRVLDRWVPLNLIPVWYEPVGGVRNWPGLRACYDLEGYSCFRINSQGWNDQNHQQEKLSGAFRVAVLGDSFIEAFQVNPEHNLVSQLEAELKSQGLSAEVLNFGMSGYRLPSLVNTLEKEVENYSPDMVVLVTDQTGYLPSSEVSRQESPETPTYRFEAGVLELDSSYLQAVENQNRSLRGFYRRIRNSSFSLMLLDRTIKNFSAGVRAIGKSSGAKAVSIPETKIVRHGVDAQTGLIRRELWKRISSFCKHHSIQLVSLVRTRASREGEEKDVEDYLALMEEMSILTIDLNKELEARGLDEAELYGFQQSRGEGHWNERGHAAVGEIISDWILQEQERRSSAL